MPDEPRMLNSSDERGAPVPAEPPAGGRLLLGWLLVIVGFVMLLLGWFGVSGEPDVARQLAYLVSGGVGGLFAGIIGVGLLISNDVRVDRERLGRVEATLLEMRDMLAAQSEVLGRADTQDTEPTQNGAGSGTGRPARKASR